MSSIKSLSKERTPAAGLGVTDMIVADSCTLCNACVESCPHKAIEINNGELMFHTEECTGCTYCQQICPERSITLSEAKGIISLSPRIVYKDDMVLCDRCKAPYVSEKMLAKISQMVGNEAVLRLCATCKQNEIYDQILGTSSQHHERVQP